ncbi:MAG: sugar nucleotide-binding protein [Candidatus Diapherotrites archaeon]|uniref:Sugar nucleotide-binding protein n=1 Tax=Candidatus Iainarchaeum sp. TaxID=3101447 RepID=A0A8T4L326_9ARCH|nr:sugar nucleotide-binding protein [Candidatus Diapherotrites archaeon]
MPKVLITGASSYVGARLYADLRKKFDVTGTYHSTPLFPELVKLDVTNSGEVQETVFRLKPDFVVHVAANPSAKWCEENPTLAKKLNEDGTQNVVDAANRIHAKVIYMSSVAAKKPSSLYGKTKGEGEKIAVQTKAGYVILRPSLIIGFSPNTVNDRAYNRLLKNIMEKTPAVYDTSWKFRPTWIGHISEIIEKVIDRNITGETIPILVPTLKSRFDIAKDLLTAFGIQAAPKDLNDTTPADSEDLDKLRQLDLPQYTYPEILEKIIRETKDYLQSIRS